MHNRSKDARQDLRANANLLELCAHKLVETENSLCSASPPTAHSSQRQTSLGKSCLTKDTGVDPVSAQISAKLSAVDRRKTCKQKPRRRMQSQHVG